MGSALVPAVHSPRSYLQNGRELPAELIGAVIIQHGGATVGDKGSKDKGKREQQKAAQHTAKEKRQLKQEKKNKKSSANTA